MEDFNFTELKRRISLYFENDSQTNEKENIFNEIQSHPNGPEVFNRERTIREKIKERVHRPSVSVGMIDQIKKIAHK